ncbi:hypothetical protein HOY80DRAFT_954252 [Tuber brumale]|nr:hypothetical protein HOY80DRAFT_954252 [Tuber brumale]
MIVVLYLLAHSLGLDQISHASPPNNKITFVKTLNLIDNINLSNDSITTTTNSSITQSIPPSPKPHHAKRGLYTTKKEEEKVSVQ